MKTGRILLALPLLASLYACQSEAPRESSVAGRTLTVRATLPGSDETRSFVTYGNPCIDKEFFRWQDKDWITLYNYSRLEDFPNGLELETTTPYINGRSAIFESPKAVNPNFEIKAGDVIFVTYWESRPKMSSSDATIDPRKIITMDVGTEANKPQYIIKDPDDAGTLYMQSNLKMYDIVTAVEDDSVPDLHFRHLSAILRVTLRNETGHDIFPTKLDFNYPETESFFNTTLYSSVDTESSEGLKLKVYDDGEFFGGTDVYTDKIGTTINGKDGTYDRGGIITNGDTYDLYISTVPKIDNEERGNKLIITLTEAHTTENSYIITLDGFNVPIQAGKRYWFNLTAVEDEETGERKLMLTSEWLKANPDAKPYDRYQ